MSKIGILWRWEYTFSILEKSPSIENDAVLAVGAVIGLPLYFYPRTPINEGQVFRLYGYAGSREL